ncbi:MAG TPA: response regulator [Polyangiaceae bacterium]|jgi:CheY-like chemotaxis protein
MSSRIILVVEDAPDIRDLLATTLRDAGYRVIESEAVGDALAILRGGAPIDAVIADYKLGDGTGVELIHQARNERAPANAELRAILCTAYGYVEVPPGVTMLRKPVHPDRLLEAVAATLAGVVMA